MQGFRCVRLTWPKIHEVRFKLISHTAYSPDLAPTDYYLFSNLKKWLGVKRFESNDEIIDAASGYFEGLDKSIYKGGTRALGKRWSEVYRAK